MTLSPIHNSLLRIDDVTGEPPAPFERPNEKFDFWVLELSCPKKDNVVRWCSRTAEVLSNHKEFLDQLRITGSRLTLFIESTASEPVLRLEVPFLKILADLGVSLELSKADE